VPTMLIREHKEWCFSTIYLRMALPPSRSDDYDVNPQKDALLAPSLLRTIKEEIVIRSGYNKFNLFG